MIAAEAGIGSMDEPDDELEDDDVEPNGQFDDAD